MSTQNPQPAPPVRLIDRILAFAALGSIVVSVLSFFTIIIGSITGMTKDDFDEGIWPIVSALPTWGLPIGLAMVMTLLLLNFSRKGRAQPHR